MTEKAATQKAPQKAKSVAIPKKSATERRLTRTQVASYLQEHPDFFERQPDLLMALAPPARWSGDAIVDIQKFMVETLKSELDGLRTCVQQVIETSRSNMSNQTRTHAAVLAILAAGDMERLIRIIQDDLPVLLDVDVADIAFEPGPLPNVDGLGLQRLAEGEVDSWISPGQEVALMIHVQDDGSVFGNAANLIQSAALVRLQPGANVPKGVLALGSRHESLFHPGQGTELLRFMSRVVERCVQRLLEIPD
ncbi:MAG: DUF484 family protein [Rhodospirillales bacterium]|nr:DUF484 family protein [Rhodospirillales bacterium]